MNKSIKILLSFLLMWIIVMPSFVVGAESFRAGTLNSYTYDYWGEGVLSPDVYKVDRVINGLSIGVEPLKNPTDMFITDDGLIYILDAGNNRIVILNSDGSLNKILSEFKYKGEITTLNEPLGIFVNNKKEIIIADTKNHRVIKTDDSGNVLLEIANPEKTINFTGVDFLPQKVIEDSNECIYILSEGIYQGAMMYEQNGEFIGYFGANRVDVTFEVMANALWRKMMTKEQREKTTKNIPVQFDNMFLDEEGFIYTVTKVSESNSNQLKKLNPKGADVMPLATSISSSIAGKYGDLKDSSVQSDFNKTKLCDVTVDESGFISVVDYFRGRIFHYDSHGNLLAAFGGLGSQAGFFDHPVAIENYNGKLYVLDQNKVNITVFTLNEYGNLLHDATVKYNDGLYNESETLWREVIKKNNNLTLAYIGLGKIYYENGDYETAMEYFKQGEDRTNYGNAFKMYRNILLRKYVFPVAGVIIVVSVLAYIAIKITKAIKKQVEVHNATMNNIKKG